MQRFLARIPLLAQIRWYPLQQVPVLWNAFPSRHRLRGDAADEPRPPGAKKLSGREAWRIRIGPYRVIYEINDEEQKVLVVVIGPRKDVYRK